MIKPGTKTEVAWQIAWPDGVRWGGLEQSEETARYVVREKSSRLKKFRLFKVTTVTTIEECTATPETNLK